MASSFSPTQKAMALAPKFSGFVSLCSSTFIIQHVLRDRKRRNLTYHRLLLGMSVSDFFGSLMCFLSTWPIPRGEAFLAVGTVNTCAAQGFFNQTAALCTPAYNISLAIYYVLVIVFGWKEWRVSRIEKYLHALPILAGFGTGTAALTMKLYNGAGWICWIAPGLPDHPERHNPDFGIYRLAFLYADAWFIICFLALAMILIYVDVRKTERAVEEFACRRGARRKCQSRRIRNQAFLYMGCMYLTWMFGSAFRLMQFAGKTPSNAIVILFVLFFPLQGFFNLVVYMFPRVVRYCDKGISITESFRSMKSKTSTPSLASLCKKKNAPPVPEKSVVDRAGPSTSVGVADGAAAGDAVKSWVTLTPEADGAGQLHRPSATATARTTGASLETAMAGPARNGEDDCESSEQGDDEDAIDELEQIVKA